MLHRNVAKDGNSGTAASCEWQQSPEGQSWAGVLEDVDIAIAERRCSEAVQLLGNADKDCAQPQITDWSDPEHQARCAYLAVHVSEQDDCSKGSALDNSQWWFKVCSSMFSGRTCKMHSISLPYQLPSGLQRFTL